MWVGVGRRRGAGKPHCEANYYYPEVLLSPLGLRVSRVLTGPLLLLGLTGAPVCRVALPIPRSPSRRGRGPSREQGGDVNAQSGVRFGRYDVGEGEVKGIPNGARYASSRGKYARDATHVINPTLDERLRPQIGIPAFTEPAAVIEHNPPLEFAIFAHGISSIS